MDKLTRRNFLKFLGIGVTTSAIPSSPAEAFQQFLGSPQQELPKIDVLYEEKLGHQEIRIYMSEDIYFIREIAVYVVEEANGIRVHALEPFLIKAEEDFYLHKITSPVDLSMIGLDVREIECDIGNLPKYLRNIQAGSTLTIQWNTDEGIYNFN